MSVSTHEHSGAVGADIVARRELSADECWFHLRAAASGRVVLVHHGRAMDIAVHHVSDGLTIVFRTGSSSPLGLLASREPAAFEIDDGDPSTTTGWRVAVTGLIERVAPQDRVGIDPAPPSWAPGRVEAWMRIIPISVTGWESIRSSAADEGCPPTATGD